MTVGLIRGLGSPLVGSYRGSWMQAKLQLAATLLRWVAAYLDQVQDMDPEDACEGYVHARAVRKAAAIVEGQLYDAACAGLMGADVTHHTTTEPRATVRLVGGTNRRRWRSEGLIAAMVAKEVERAVARHPHLQPSEVQQIVTEAVYRLITAARPEWRVTGLRRLGIDPDDWCDQSPSAPRLVVEGG